MIAGAQGQVGSELAVQSRSFGITAVALTRAQLDIRNREAVRQAILEAAPDYVVNAAAYNAVDRAEKEPDTALAVNRDGPAHLASACATVGIPLVHISTDYVFDGTQAWPYRETDSPAPLGRYGLSKLMGELAVREKLDRHIILRVSWVFSHHRDNFVRTVLRLAKTEERLRMVADQESCPTAAQDIAGMILRLARQYQEQSTLPWGTYHYCGAPATSRFDYAQAIVDVARTWQNLKVTELTPVPSSEFAAPAKRPTRSVLDCRHTCDTFGIEQPRWQPALKIVLEQLCSKPV